MRDNSAVESMAEKDWIRMGDSTRRTVSSKWNGEAVKQRGMMRLYPDITEKKSWGYWKEPKTGCLCHDVEKSRVREKPPITKVGGQRGGPDREWRESNDLRNVSASMSAGYPSRTEESYPAWKPPDGLFSVRSRSSQKGSWLGTGNSVINPGREIKQVTEPQGEKLYTRGTTLAIKEETKQETSFFYRRFTKRRGGLCRSRGFKKK